MVRARSPSASAETVRAVATLCTRSRWRNRTCLGTFYRLALAVHVRAIVSTLRFGVPCSLTVLAPRPVMLGCSLCRQELGGQNGKEKGDSSAFFHLDLLNSSDQPSLIQTLQRGLPPVPISRCLC